MKQKFNILRSHCVSLPIDNIDTDQLIPARFLKATSREGFGENLFADWRRRPDGSDNPDFVLNFPQSQGAKILVAGDNFGCGSSREHAAWAIADAGFRAVVATSFADIHRNNELNNFVLPVTVTPVFLKSLHATISAFPGAEIEINLPEQTITNPVTGEKEKFEINPYKKHCLMEGLDDIDYLLSTKDKITAFEKGR